MICYVPVVMGAKYQIRLEDLEADFAVQFTCFSCSHISIMPAGFFKAKYQPHTRVGDLEEKFKCSKCRNQIFNSWKIVRQIRHDQPAAGQQAAE